ncbi:uncharacterized protein LOC118512530 isoform X1 [Anopheles stephensi]|uniref:uncharacterized protein LOC118512530 isoform X1 n=1 Tax=Anopheles stephensi TaxID=30069 RepID=UPI001658A0F2|nr:uncharacterized protein LOC118512530 isoform X1 [Anopheles stephensi]XP_035912973.1 uncharacterized protein LOC118512530 isoform X1 [Anopheles stephensi]
MIGIKPRDAVKPVVKQCATKKRPPLGDIDVNRGHHKILPSKHGQHDGKGYGLKVFADGETSSTKKKESIQISTKLASTLNDAKKKLVGGKKPFQFIDELRNGAQSVTRDTCVAMKKPQAAAAVQVADTDRLEEQLALMSVGKMHNKTRHQIPGTGAQGVESVTKEASNAHAHAKEMDLKVHHHDADTRATLKSVSQTQEPKSATSSNGTGAIRKVVPEAYEMPTFQLNVQAKEWKPISANASNGPLTNPNGTVSGSTRSSSVDRQLPSSWNLQLDDDANLTKQRGKFSGTYRHHDLPSTVYPCGRKIVGRQSTSLERKKQPASRDIMRELDDRTQEIERYERYKESRRKKAIEAMRVEQERLKWSAQAAQQQPLRLDVPTYVQNQCQPAVFGAATNHTSTGTVAGMHGFRRTNGSISSHSLHSQVPLAPPVKSPICIMKYPTPPNIPIRYKPEQLLELNYTARKETDKRYEVQQDIFSTMTHFTIG